MSTEEQAPQPQTNGSAQLPQAPEKLQQFGDPFEAVPEIAETGDPGDENKPESAGEEAPPAETPKDSPEKPQEGQAGADTGTIKIKSGDSEQALDSSAELDLGLGKKYTLKEVKSRLEVEDRIRQDLGKLGDEKHRFAAEKEQLKAAKAELDAQLRTTHEFLQGLNKGIESGNPVEVVNSVIEMAGGHGPSFWAELFSKIGPEVAEFAQLDETERRALVQQHKNAALEKRLNKDEEARNKAQQATEEKQYVQGLLNHYGLTEGDYNAMLQQLKTLESTGKLNYMASMSKKEKINEIVQYAVGTVWNGRIEQAFKGSNLNFGEQLTNAATDIYRAVQGYRPQDVSDETLSRLVSSWAEEAGLNSSDAKPKEEAVAKEDKPAPKKDDVELLEAQNLAPGEVDYQGIEPISFQDLMD